MRIAFLIDQFPALSETFILGQITGLIDRGYEVDIFTDRPGNTAQMHPEVERYRLLDRTYYNKVPKNILWRVIKAIMLFVVYLIKAPKTLLQVLAFPEYKFAKYGELAGFLKLFYLVVPFLNKPRYDIIHCHYGRNGLKAIMLKDLGIIQGKIIVAFHGYDISRYLQIHGEDIYDYLFSKADLLQPISRHWQQKLIALGCNETKITVHHMGIDCNKFTFISHRASRKQIRLVSIARLVEKKGLQYGIEAVSKLVPSYPHLEYQIIGDGVLQADLQRLIDQLNVGENVKLLGWREQQEVAAIIADADLVLAPSVTSLDGDCEGIPVSLMEAMAEGLPVVSTYHSGIPELIQDGVSGYLVAEREVDTLAAKINYLLINPEIGREMGLAGRKIVETDYNIEILNDLLAKIYQQLI
jgi:colanic acid/amylovoran biosynthesis glycosyltransferase